MRGQTKQDSLWEETEEKTSNDVYCVTGSWHFKRLWCPHPHVQAVQEDCLPWKSGHHKISSHSHKSSTFKKTWTTWIKKTSNGGNISEWQQWLLVSPFLLSPTSTAVSVVGYGRTWSHSITQSVHRTPLDKGLACQRDLYLTTHNTHKKHTSMLLVGFEPTIPASGRPQTHALDHMATSISTGTGNLMMKGMADLYTPDFYRKEGTCSQSSLFMCSVQMTYIS